MSALNVGDTAPDFTSIDQSGNNVTLSNYLGRRVILYFYPKDNTPGCTAEACSIRNGYNELKQMGFEVIGVSPDSQASHLKFIEKYNLPYTLISDQDHSVAVKYGAWGEKKFMGRTYDGILRTTFIIDRQGKIEKIFNKVNTKAHFEQIVDSYK